MTKMTLRRAVFGVVILGLVAVLVAYSGRAKGQTLPDLLPTASPAPPQSPSPARTPEPAPTPSPQPAATPRARQANSSERIAAVWPGDDRWAVRTAWCEAGHQPRRVNRSGKYRGTWQHARATWNRNRPYAERDLGRRLSVDPVGASLEEQTLVAWHTYRREGGTRPWPTCKKASYQQRAEAQLRRAGLWPWR